MGNHTLIPAVIQHTNRPEHEPLLSNNNKIPYSSATALAIYDSYSSGPSRAVRTPGVDDSHAAEESGTLYGDDLVEEEFDMDDRIAVTWRYMSRLYLLVPIITLTWFILLVLLVTYAWPPTKKERQEGQQYPHPFLPNPFLIGIFASCTIQTIRVATYVVVSWTGLNLTVIGYLSRTLHTIIHELLRLSTLPLICPSLISGFHSSYYLGLGWGTAEVTWGIIQGWEQLALYQEVMLPCKDEEPSATLGKFKDIAKKHLGQDNILSSVEERDEDNNSIDDINRQYDRSISQEEVGEETDEDDETVDIAGEEEEDETELERKVEILERIRARRELEDVLGLPFPNIPFPFHLLWRLDTLLLNLGLTLILSAFYFNPTPIYHQFHSTDFSIVSDAISVNHKSVKPGDGPSHWLWLTWTLVTVAHVGVSLVWKVVGRVGVGAVTWGGLIVSLGSVFAGLGAWGGLV
ncbi:hypothetical protein L204_106262 [Cryptococcus depauperatus]|nr:hypothetical protein L204_05827 [Cryptococcus depauperatus CBS 7855]